MLYVLLIILHIFVSCGLILFVLMQSSKGGGLAGTFGGSGMAGSVFGGRGAAPFLTKATTVCAILFMLTSLSLNFVRPGRQSSSVLERTLREGGVGSEPAVTNEMPIQLDTPTDENTPVDAETDTEENNDSE